MKKATSVSAYIAAAPPAVRARLKQLRQAIKRAAPNAAERISYGMPFYEYGGTGYKGRLVYFAVFKKHISLFIIARHAETVAAELAKYHAGKATYRFDLDKPIPFTLIGRTVKALVRERDKQSNSKRT